MICNKCGKELKEGAKFCTKCGAAVVLKKICPKCKAENDIDDMFCFECGTKLDEENSNKTGEEKELTMEAVNRVMEKVFKRYDERQKKEKEIQGPIYLVPCADPDINYGIKPSRSRQATIYVVRRRGFGDYNNDERFPAKTIEEVKQEMKATWDLQLKTDYATVMYGKKPEELECVAHPEFKGIGPYCLVEDGIFFEKNDTIYYMNAKKAQKIKIVDMSAIVPNGFAVSCMQYDMNKEELTVYVITDVHQTEWNKETDICGGMGSEFYDEFQADQIRKVIKIKYETLMNLYKGL